MNTSYEQTDAATVVPKDAFLKPYIRLRTVIDALEATALRYCLADKKASERIRRAEELEGMIHPVVRKIAELSGISSEMAGGCGDGYNNCGGVCVPYACPEDTVDS